MGRDQRPTKNTAEEQQSREEQQKLRCANCEIEFQWSPTIVRERTYCCSGCASGGPCCCDYSQYHSVNISGIIHYEPDEETKSVDSQRS